MLWLEPIFHIDCFISVHLSSYLLIFAWVRQRKRRQLNERVATLVQNPLMNTVVQPNEVETGQFRQFYPKLDNCEIMLEAILGFKSWMTRIVIIWIIPETAFLFRVDTRPCIYGINVMFIVQELQYVQGWEVFAPLATSPGQPDTYLVCRTYKELKMCRKRGITFNLKIQHLFVTAAVRLQPAELTGQLNIFSFVSSNDFVTQQFIKTLSYNFVVTFRWLIFRNIVALFAQIQIH